MVKSSLPNLESLPPIYDTSETGVCSLSLLTQVVEHLPVAVSITDRAGIIQYANSCFSKSTGYPINELIGQNHSILSFKATPAEIYKNLWRDICDGETWQGRLINKKKNGDRYLAEIKIIPLKSHLDEITYFMAIQQDISDSHVKNTEIINQNKMFSIVLNTIPSAVAVLNEQQEVVLNNLSYQNLAIDFNVELADLVLKELKLQLNIPVDESIGSSHFPTSNNINIELGDKNNQRWFACRLLSLEMSDLDLDSYFSKKKAMHLMLSITEYTREKRRAERQRIAELKQMVTETEMMHAMQETTHAVLHQLQAPVNMIESAVNLLKDKPEMCSGLYPMNMALSAGNDALSQLRNALPERVYEAKQSVNINQLLHELSLICMPPLLQHGIDLQLSFTATLPTLIAQPSRLRVAFKKLLDNAIDSIVINSCLTREILISTRSDHDGITITFEDSGSGVPKSKLLKVFQPFYTTKPFSMAGTRGIGLSVVQQVINEHCGTVEIKTSKLGGCLVCVYLSRY